MDGADIADRNRYRRARLRQIVIFSQTYTTYAWTPPQEESVELVFAVQTEVRTAPRTDTRTESVAPH